MSAVLDMMASHAPGVTCLGPSAKVGHWRWRCDCGAEFARRGAAVRLAIRRQGRTSCGCLHLSAVKENGKRNRRHGWAADDRKLYSVWRQMLRRCETEECKDFPAYGGRGIAVCQEWHDVSAFCEWAHANGYRAGLSIDRIDGSLGYAPGNCRWATATEQARNIRRNRQITAFGETLCISEWSARTGIRGQTILTRLRLGWAPERVVGELPLRGRNQYSEGAS